MNGGIKVTFISLFMAILMISGCGQKEETSMEKPPILEPRVTEGEILRLAVQPTTKPVVALKRYKPVVDYLKQTTKLNIELTVTDSYKDFADSQKQGKVDFVIQDAFSTYLISQHTTLVPIANVISPKGLLNDPGYIIVRSDSDINELNDLKGKRLLFGPKANAAKFLAPYVLLKQSGIDVEKDLTYDFGGTCPNNAMSVFIGDYDAGVVCGLYMAQKDKKFNFKNDLRVIAETGDWVPYWIVSSFKKTDKVIVNKVKQALIELDMENTRTAEVLSVCKWRGFAPYTDEITKIAKLAKEYAVPN